MAESLRKARKLAILRMHGAELSHVELGFESSKHALDLVFNDETTRLSGLRILLLENENDDLHHQLAEDDNRIDSLEHGTQNLQSKVETLEADLLTANAELRIRDREMDNLKVGKCPDTLSERVLISIG